MTGTHTCAAVDLGKTCKSETKRHLHYGDKSVSVVELVHGHSKHFSHD